MPTNSQPWMHPDDVVPKYGDGNEYVSPYDIVPPKKVINLEIANVEEPETPSVSSAHFVVEKKVKHDSFALFSVILFPFFLIAWVLSISAIVRIKNGKPAAKGDFEGAVVIFILSSIFIVFAVAKAFINPS